MHALLLHKYDKLSNLHPRALFLTGALGNPETKCFHIGFREEQSKASLIGTFMLVSIRGEQAP